MYKTMKKNHVLDLDALTIAAAIRKGDITSSDTVKAYISHLQAINNDLNCLVEDRYEEALKEAEQADRSVKNGKSSGSLFGVPISMKESFHVKGMRTTGGLPHRKDIVEAEDADIVARLKSEGAIILGKSNTPTLCFCQETENKLYGRTNNPWNVERTAGGSSGGEGVLIAAGGAAAGIGSDIGGSIRFPSHFNGVIGFKSGNGQVSDKGSFPPVAHPLQKRMLGMGPMAKSISDAQSIYNIIANTPANPVELDSMAITFLPKTGHPLSQETTDMLVHLKRELASSFSVKEDVPPGFEECSLLWQEIMSIDGARSTAEAASKIKGKPIKAYREYFREKITGKSDVHPYLSWALIGAGLFRPNSKRIAAIETIIQEGDRRLDDYLRNRVLIFPVYYRSAPRHGELYAELFSIKKTFLRYMPFTAYANVWGLPSLTMPAGLDHEGMPIGIQLIAKAGNEEALFRIGSHIEEITGGYSRCKAFDRDGRQG
ncbi:MAG TPA: amidase [Bacillaceae bacterium]